VAQPGTRLQVTVSASDGALLQRIAASMGISVSGVLSMLIHTTLEGKAGAFTATVDAYTAHPAQVRA
jgi:hypothetical protein